MSRSTTTADSILDCAQALITKGGYNGFSYADIAEVVGIRKASIHHHFPSKAELVRALISRYRADARDGFVQIESITSDPREQLALYIGYWERCLLDGTAPICICALLAGELPVLPTEIAAEVRLHFDTLSKFLTGILGRGADGGTFQLSDTAGAEAHALMATVHGGMLSARVAGDPKLFGTITAASIARLTH